MKLLALLLVAFGTTLSAQEQPIAHGVIYGTVTGPDGVPARNVGLTARTMTPIGAILPHARADEQGHYRFNNIPWWGRYTVFAEDDEAGYAPWTQQSSAAPAEVQTITLSAEHPQAEFNLRLPPPSGSLALHLVDRQTGAEINNLLFHVSPADNPEGLIVSGGYILPHLLLLPPEEDVVVHIGAQHYQEWSESLGRGKLFRLRSGEHRALQILLDPRTPDSPQDFFTQPSEAPVL